jgi:hypothetical protein
VTRFVITFSVPAGEVRAGNLRQSFQRIMFEALHIAFDPMLDDIKGQTPYASIREGYYTEDAVLGNRIAVTALNRVPHWVFRENDTRPHWPPYGKGTSLERWATARGIPAFLVARKISREGTKGNYIVGRTWDRYRSRLDVAIQEGLYAWVLDSMGQPGRGN